MRLKTPAVKIRGIKIGGRYPIVIQSMTNTDTADAEATAAQCIELADAGSELVRITVNNEAAAKAVPEIRRILDNRGYKDLPLIGDFHYNSRELLAKFSKCAEILDKYRINPGNVNDENFAAIVKIAIKYKKPIRIGVNSGSLKNSAVGNMVKVALKSAKYAEKIGLKQNKIILSVKASSVRDTINAYELLAEKMRSHLYALHLGLTEAGSGIQGTVFSSAALSILLQKGIGDTIRVSLTPKPDYQNTILDQKTSISGRQRNKFNQARIQEIEVCKALLQSLGLRHFRPHVISCPGCGRTDNIFFQKMVEKINDHINKNLPAWQKKHPNINKLKIAVMGCVVNGPGESRHADIAISLPGRNEKSIAQVYIKGKFYKNLAGKDIANQFIKIFSKHIVKLIDLSPPMR